MTSLAPPRADRAQLIAAAALLAALTLAVSRGAVSISPAQLLAAPLDRLGLAEHAALTPAQEAVLWAIRLPRALMAVGVGGALGLAGALMQGLTRNPLADPGLLGVSSGAALGGAAATVLGGRVGALGLPVAAILGGLLTWTVVMAVARREGAAPIPTLLLCGVAVSALASSGVGLLLFMASDEQLRALTFWTLGSLSGASWGRALGVLAALGLSLAVTGRAARALNALLLGEAEAAQLGVPVEGLKLTLTVLVALLVGLSVAFSGFIGFIGLVAPPSARLLVGADQRRVLPLSALLGACLLTLADLAARTVVAPAELPVGVLTALLGAPFFLARLRAAGLGG
ncbi:iron ABC transporter permease [Myxococcota bacterium]|nr:iron ABC transporter permease [Myxococcota bacterium]